MRLIHIICDKDHFDQISKATSYFGEVTHYQEPPEDTVDAFIIAHVRHAGATGADVWFRWEDDMEYEDTEISHLVLPRDMDRLVDILQNVFERGDALMLSPSLLDQLDDGPQVTGEVHFTVSESLSDDDTPTGIRVPADETVAMAEEGMTSPGFRFEGEDSGQIKTTTGVVEADSGMTASAPEPSDSVDDRGPADPARTLWQLHQDGFDGYLDVPLKGSRSRLWWRGGIPVAVEGAGALLVRLLQTVGEVRVNTFLLERSSDPVALAVRQGSIQESEVDLWRRRLMVEVMVTLCSLEILPHPSSEPTYSVHSSWDVEFKGLLIRATVEGYDAARSMAMMGGSGLGRLDVSLWESVRYSPLMDSAWIQAVGLAASGIPWREAVIRSGMSVHEGYSLLYALRLTGVAVPGVPEYPTRYEMVRRRINGLLDRAERFPPEELLDGRGAVARRRYQDIMVMLSEIPPDLAVVMADRINTLKTFLDRALEKVG